MQFQKTFLDVSRIQYAFKKYMLGYFKLLFILQTVCKLDRKEKDLSCKVLSLKLTVEGLIVKKLKYLLKF